MTHLTAAIFIASMFDVSVVDGEPFCARLTKLSETSGRQTATFELQSDGQNAVTCAPALGQNGTRSLHCAWPFAYRSGQGADAFDAMLVAVADCAVQIPSTPSKVNHPDSYDLRQFQMGTTTVSVSLKDKSALSQTYLFLRVERP